MRNDFTKCTAEKKRQNDKVPVAVYSLTIELIASFLSFYYVFKSSGHRGVGLSPFCVD